MAPPKKTTFMDLPLEIRTIVYTSLFAGQEYRVAYHKRMPGLRPNRYQTDIKSLAVLQVCRSLRCEAMPIMRQFSELVIDTVSTATNEFRLLKVLPPDHYLLSLNKVSFAPSYRGYTAPKPLFKLLPNMRQLTLRAHAYNSTFFVLKSSSSDSVNDLLEILDNPEERQADIQATWYGGTGYYYNTARRHRLRETSAAVYWARSRDVEVRREYSLRALTRKGELVMLGDATLHVQTKKLTCNFVELTFDIEDVDFH